MMDEFNARSLYTQRIDLLVESLLPHGGGPMTEHRLRFALGQVAEVAFTAGESYALSSLLTCDDLVVMLGLSRRRVNALAKRAHERHGIGMQIGGAWLFRPAEVEYLRPGPEGWPKGRPRRGGVPPMADGSPHDPSLPEKYHPMSTDGMEDRWDDS